MIRHLDIKNYALIESLELTPSRKLNTITGETGAGKSIMLGAIGLLLGNRADVKTLLHEDQKCVVEGTFDIKPYQLQGFFNENELDYDDDCIIRREISPSGKSRAFINDTPVTLDILKTLGSRLVDIHSQNETLRLGATLYQLELVDTYAGTSPTLKEYQATFATYNAARKEYEDLKAAAENMRQERDYQQFLFDELDKANLLAGEQSELEEEQKLAENAEDIKVKLLENVQLLRESEAAVDVQLQTALRNLESIQGFSGHLAELKKRLEQASIEIKDITQEIENEEQRVEFDQGKAESINERLSLIYQLQQKHQVQSVEELIGIQKSLEEKLLKVESLDDELAKRETGMEEAYAAMMDIATALSERRKSSLPPFRDELLKLIADLGMPNASVEFQHKTIEPGMEGIDEITILFSANKGIKPDQLKNVASGGEFSRLMFAIKFLMARKSAMPTVIFDEIDSGISGEISLKMVNMMQEMATNHQVVVITHLPQIAARGHQHYYVYKDEGAPKTVSKIRLLLEHERIEEVAKMIGGDQPTRAALENARELLQQAE